MTPRMKPYFRLMLGLMGFGLVSGQTPSVLNLSHDLVTNGIATQNMTPNMPALHARPLFQAGINYALKNHIPW